MNAESVPVPNPEATPEEPRAKIGEDDVEAAIAACGGDLTATIRALLVAQTFLEAALEEARQEASWAYVRGRPSRQASKA
ncbi:CUE domain-containing protein [Ancylobacter terrae]|uniref:CUE domain-containing protein n=1 Tax=Ancylobacter sp. sgz301288 TaxID=3342077 RepID=UPI00385DC3C4